VSQTQNKPTLKEFMEQPMTTGSQYNQTLSTGGNGYVVSQTQNKSTLKEFMEQPMTTGSQYNQTLSTGGNGYVVSQTQNKSTLKEFMEQPMTTGSQYNQTLSTGGNGYVVSQTQNKPTLKEFMEQPMTTGSQYNQTLSTGGNGYVVTQTQNKSTLKEFMEQAFDMGNFSDGGDNFTGGYIDFQGPVLETARAYYEYLPAVGRPANFSDGVGGDFVGNGIVTSRQNRGTDSLDWVTLSKVPQDAEDTSVTWIGVYDRDTKRELAPNIPMSDLAPSYESVAGRMFGALTPKCNLDLHQTQDEWLWSAGFAPQMPDVITG
jgi:isopenicillin N synthase-like dioxygenase